tara:strand:+ start:7115 stop:8134 length:1020 start_codon:yes stop_codon:yes gene_type:complete
MNLKEITKPITAKSLNETLAKRFGKKLNVQDFTNEQLDDARNKLRTQLSAIETTESFDDVHKSDTYQKSKLMLDVLNAEISERNTISEFNKEDEKEADKDSKKMQKKGSHATSSPSQGGSKKVNEKEKKPDDDGDGVPDWADKKPGEDDHAKKDSKGGKGLSAKQKKLPKGLQKAIAKKKTNEGKEDEAELVMASKDMVDRVTSWMEDTAEMQTESMLELADAIRDEMGIQQSDAFVQTVKPALESMYAAMETTRAALTQGVGMLTGEGEAPPEDMGGEPDPEAPAVDDEMEPTVDQEDEFAAAEAGAGGEEEAGRAKRESVEMSRRLGQILAGSKKKS